MTRRSLFKRLFGVVAGLFCVGGVGKSKPLMDPSIVSTTSSTATYLLTQGKAYRFDFEANEWRLLESGHD